MFLIFSVEMIRPHNDPTCVYVFHYETEENHQSPLIKVRGSYINNYRTNLLHSNHHAFEVTCLSLQICNMLKKKHGDAKELLVRAVVNNNLLLMLNHPIHEEKISFSYIATCLFFFSVCVVSLNKKFCALDHQIHPQSSEVCKQPGVQGL